MSKSVAIIGASADRGKFGNKAVRAFRDANWDVYPVNISEVEIEGIPAYRTIGDVPAKVDRVTMYVSPKVGRTMIDAIAAKAPGEVFFNPGSHDPELIELARQKGLNVICACSIINIGKHPDMYPNS